METYWIKITKWHNNKPDFCSVKAENKKEALYYFEDQLNGKGNLRCTYFSTKTRYNRNINDIMNFEFVEEDEVRQHINKINFAIQKQQTEELTLND